MRVIIAIAITLVACGGTQPSSNNGATRDLSQGDGAKATPVARAALADGTYWCTMTVTDFAYEPKPCVVSGGKLRKDIGTMRFNGDLEPAGGGFVMVGVFCDGACDEPFRTEFSRLGNRWIGDIALEGRTWNVVVQPWSAYGGDSYGGAGYAYGGAAISSP
jgi:hypothetical protein